ncbi:MAG TPA: DUF4249 domain-containing protein [Cyclobacteriaceae bacterium]|jgi:hypothetical protein|nr:DUF4249 domain-containing protein [Cyclobacteriaceae bacterium]
MRRAKLYRFAFVVVMLVQCKDPFVPPVSTASQNFLVVDGFVNSTDSIAQVKLSRATPLSSVQRSPAESGAVVSIETDLGSFLSLSESSSGVYSLKSFFANDRKYKLHIQTSDGEKYSSEFISLQKAPPLDSITWSPQADGLALFVNSHDPEGQTKYFRWTYEETWEHISFLHSGLIYDPVLDTVFLRPPDQQIDTCWTTLPSTSIQLYATSNLQQDDASNYQLFVLPKGSEKLAIKYSVLVKQQALSEEAFNFWSQLRNTSENLGGLFDPLPSQVNGNILCETDPSKIALGFFSGGSVTSKRTFMSFFRLPQYLQIYPLFPEGYGCFEETIPLAGFDALTTDKKASYIWDTEDPSGYQVTAPACGDCRMQGGVNKKPSFWK